MPSPPTLFLSPAMFFLLRSHRPSPPHPLLQRCRRRWRASCRQCKCGGGQRPIRGGRGAANWTEGSCGFGSAAAPGPTVSGDGGRHEQRLPARLGPRGVEGHDAPAGSPGADGVRPRGGLPAAHDRGAARRQRADLPPPRSAPRDPALDCSSLLQSATHHRGMERMLRRWWKRKTRSASSSAWAYISAAFGGEGGDANRDNVPHHQVFRMYFCP